MTYNMRKKVIWIFGAAVVLAAVMICAALYCSRYLISRDEDALDTILMCESNLEAGLVVFPHYAHYGPESQGGNDIACIDCHHPLEGPDAQPLQACRSCHHSHYEASSISRVYL